MVDARDPLLYQSNDLEEYARDLHASKTSLVLLNKADLLPVHVREAWADFFDRVSIWHTSEPTRDGDAWVDNEHILGG